MDFQKEVLTLLEAIGEKAKVTVGENEYSINAIIQPMRYKNKLYIEQERTELGFRDTECFLYLGPAEPDFAGLESDTVIYSRDRVYNVSRADRISLKGITQYIWAVLTPRVKDGETFAL